MTDRELIESYIPLVKFIAAICGPRCEVVLHYTENIEHSIIAIENGYITGRKIGDGLMDYILTETLFTKQPEGLQYTTNYCSKIGDPERTLRFSSYYIRNDSGVIIGFLNVTMDITDMVICKDYLDASLNLTEDPPIFAEAVQAKDRYVISATQMFNDIFKQALKEIGPSDTAKMRKDDKKRILEILDGKNVFSLRGTVRLAAKKLRMSEPSVYRYLRDIRSADGM